MRIDKIRLFLGVFEQKFVKCTIVRTKFPKIRPNLTQLFATLTKTQGFTKKKKSFWKNGKNKHEFRVFEQKFQKLDPI